MKPPSFFIKEEEEKYQVFSVFYMQSKLLCCVITAWVMSTLTFIHYYIRAESSTTDITKHKKQAVLVIG